MEKLSFIVSLVDRNNDYQRAQAAAAEDAARRLDVDVQLLFAAGDAVERSQQLSAVIQSKPRGSLESCCNRLVLGCSS